MKEKTRIKIQIKPQTNNSKTKSNLRIRYINGVKTYYKAGSWYCDYNHYREVKQQQGIGTNIDVFCSWCTSHDLEPTG